MQQQPTTCHCCCCCLHPTVPSSQPSDKQQHTPSCFKNIYSTILQDSPSTTGLAAQFKPCHYDCQHQPWVSESAKRSGWEIAATAFHQSTIWVVNVLPLRCADCQICLIQACNILSSAAGSDFILPDVAHPLLH